MTEDQETVAAERRLAILFGKCPKRDDGIEGHAWKNVEHNSETPACRFCGEPWPYR